MNVTATRKPGPGLGLSISVLVAGLVLGVVALILFVGSFWSTFTEPAFEVPGTVEVDLDSGEHLVYERDAAFGGSIRPRDVTVTSPDGRDIDVDPASTATQTITRSGASYVGVARFDVPSDGVYTIEIDVENPTEVVVAPSLVAGLRGAIGSVLLSVVAAALFLLGLIMLLVGIVRRRGAAKAAVAVGGAPGGWPPAGAPGGGGAMTPGWPTTSPASGPPSGPFGPGGAGPVGVPSPAPGPAPAAPPAGWYPDPDRPGGQRWWDGQQWTEHRA